MTTKVKAFVLCVRRHMQRMNRITDQLASAGIPFEVVYGPDCAAGGWRSLVEASPEALNTLPPNALCITMGHYWMMRLALSQGLEHALFLEDDADFTATAENLAEAVEDLPPGWHIAHIGRNDNTAVAEETELFIGASSVETALFSRARQLQYGAFAYLLSRAGIEYFLGEGLPIFTPIDCMFRFRAEFIQAYAPKSPLIRLHSQSAEGIRVVAEEELRREPPQCIRAESEGVCHVLIPYRDREEHLAEWARVVPQRMGVPSKVTVVEQAGSAPFNKGKLLNAGFSLARPDFGGGDFVCFHDVDMLPEGSSADYSKPALPTHLSRFISQRNYLHLYDGWFGGVTLWTPEHFEMACGFSNNFWGWGLEDDDLFNRAKAAGLPVLRRNGRFWCLHHTPATFQPFVGTDEQVRELEGGVSPSYGANVVRMFSQDYRASVHSDGLAQVQFSVVGERTQSGLRVVTVDIGEP